MIYIHCTSNMYLRWDIVKSKKEIQETYIDCLNAVDDYALSNEGGNLINQGWIEALEYVLGKDRSKNAKGKTSNLGKAVERD